jgi:DNA-directed RNA polymerase subunit RPC12/RpoP
MYLCLHCGTKLYRSQTRNLSEKIIKIATSGRYYRCFKCPSRGLILPQPKIDLLLARGAVKMLTAPVRFLNQVTTVLVTSPGSDKSANNN